MIPNIHQSIDEIIKAASPAEKIMWQQVRLLAGENASIQQVFYQGVVAGHEILTYSSSRLWLALEFNASQANGVALAAQSHADLYDQNNAISSYFVEGYPLWDTTAAIIKYSRSSMLTAANNILFSRIAFTYWNYFKFIGYKITF